MKADHIKLLFLFMYFGISPPLFMCAQDIQNLTNGSTPDLLNRLDSLSGEHDAIIAAKFLSNSAPEVQAKALSILGRCHEPNVVGSLLDYLSSINVIVEGSEASTVNLNLKHLAVAAIESNSLRSFKVVDLNNIEELQSRIREQIMQWPKVKQTTPKKEKPELNKAATANFDESQATVRNNASSSSPTWINIIVLIVAATGLFWLFLNKRK